jgi:DNA polymerase-1
LTDEEESMRRQLIRLIQYLEFLPINIISLDNVEADDTMAYCALQYFKERVSIMSSDKDFLQLVNDRISVWSPSKKKLYGVAEVVNEYHVHPNNFVMVRALDGDPSDNIPGVKGFGFKTALKLYPELVGPEPLSVESMINYAKEHKTERKAFNTLLESRSDFERNIALMQLSDTYLTTTAQLTINEILNNKPNKLNRFGFTNLVREDKLSAGLPQHLSWVNEVFSKLDAIIV